MFRVRVWGLGSGQHGTAAHTPRISGPFEIRAGISGMPDRLYPGPRLLLGQRKTTLGMRELSDEISQGSGTDLCRLAVTKEVS